MWWCGEVSVMYFYTKIRVQNFISDIISTVYFVFSLAGFSGISNPTKSKIETLIFPHLSHHRVSNFLPSRWESSLTPSLLSLPPTQPLSKCSGRRLQNAYQISALSLRLYGLRADPTHHLFLPEPPQWLLLVSPCFLSGHPLPHSNPRELLKL